MVPRFDEGISSETVIPDDEFRPKGKPCPIAHVVAAIMLQVGLLLRRRTIAGMTAARKGRQEERR